MSKLVRLVWGNSDSADKAPLVDRESVMRKAGKWLIALLITALWSGYSYGSVLDQCVLEHMQGIKSNAAAYDIKLACLRQVSKKFPTDSLAAFTNAKARYGELQFPDHGSYGLYVTFNNNSGYTFTQVTIAVTNKRTSATARYVVHNFAPPEPPGAIAAGPPLDPTENDRMGLGLHTFSFKIEEAAPSASAWYSTYSWEVISAKGFRD